VRSCSSTSGVLARALAAAVQGVGNHILLLRAAAVVIVVTVAIVAAVVRHEMYADVMRCRLQE
jgi:hypothetical protein